jgi:hypothetical protein
MNGMLKIGAFPSKPDQNLAEKKKPPAFLLVSG